MEEASNAPQKSLLEMTIQDHRDMHSTPDDNLIANPGKTKAELMSDEEISQYLSDLDDSATGKFADMYIDELERTKKYLVSIGRLPERFKESRS